jgi:predicted aspartyl protease
VTFAFDPDQGLVIVRAELEGPSGSALLRLALDTGATGTLINAGMLVAIGYDPALATERTEVTTGSGVEFVPRIALSKLTALGQERVGFPVLCHTLPPSAGVDGLLGLDFFRGQIVTVDLRRGRITLS